VQLFGRVSGPILAAQTGLPNMLANLISAHAIDFYVMSEDLPDPESRVTLKGDEIVLNWTRTNWASHEALVAKLKAAAAGGFPGVAVQGVRSAHAVAPMRHGADGDRPRTVAWSRPWGGPMTTPISGSRMRACCPPRRR
jgi:hypothetical protein